MENSNDALEDMRGHHETLSQLSQPASQSVVQQSQSVANPQQPMQPVTNPDPQLQIRSCVTCRRRKVRCNRRHPCSNCVKAGIECIFPTRRAPRKSRRPPESDILDRLRRLEGVVESLGATAVADRPDATRAPVPEHPQGSASTIQEPETSNSDSWPGETGVREQIGRLVIDDSSRSRYVSNRFWASLGDQIEELRDLLESSSEDEVDDSSPQDSVKSASQNHDSFLLGYHSVAHTLRSYHPTTAQTFALWNIYEQNVAPLVSLLHRPTAWRILSEAATRVESLDKNTEALVFAVYLSAVISMSPEQAQQELGEDRDSAINRFRFATEQALARANFLHSQNLTLLQAAVLFLTVIRAHDSSRFVWTLVPVVIRFATSLGIHRDGTNFGLSPYETEVRRRLWWHICILDVRSAEDYGMDPIIHDEDYDTRLFLNVNDEDLTQEMSDPPAERVGMTDVTFSLMRSEVVIAYRQVMYTPLRTRVIPKLGQRLNLVKSLNDRLQALIIRHCDMSIPIHWLTATLGRLIVAKLWLIVHHPLINDERPTMMPHVVRDQMLRRSVEMIEFSHLLETNEETTCWGWLFNSYSLWHAVAFVLAEVCLRPPSPDIDRGWAAVNAVFRSWEKQNWQTKGVPFRPLSKLMKRAIDVRQMQRMRERSGESLSPSSQSVPPPGSQTTPSSITSPSSRLMMGVSTPDFNPSNTGSSRQHSASKSRSPQRQQQQQQQRPNASMSFDLDLSQSMPDLLQDILPLHGMTGPITPETVRNQSIPLSPPSTRQASEPGHPGPIDTAPNSLGMPLSPDRPSHMMRDFGVDWGNMDGIGMIGSTLGLF